MGGKQVFGDFVLDVKTHSSIGKHAHILSLYKHIVLSLRTLLRRYRMVHAALSEGWFRP